MIKDFNKKNIKNKIIFILSRYIQLKQIDLNGDFDTYDIDLRTIYELDSLGIVEIFMEIETYFNIELKDDDIFKFTKNTNLITINTLTDFIYNNAIK